MHDAGAGEEVPSNPAHTLPGDCSLMAAPAETTLPDANHLVVEGLYGVEVQGHRVVVDVPTDDRGQPLPHLGNRVVPAPAEGLLDLPQLGPNPLAHGLPHQRETPFPRLAANVRKAEEGERLGLAPCVPLAVLRRVAAELDQAGLFGV